MTQHLCCRVQDPKYPVENLLHEDSLRPWLSCPQDRSRQLKVELQLERASPIGYVDVGMCPPQQLRQGCALDGVGSPEPRIPCALTQATAAAPFSRSRWDVLRGRSNSPTSPWCPASR